MSAKVWLITGSSRGFGRSLAEAVIADGDRLVATARRASDVADLVEKGQGRVIGVALDVTDDDAAKAAVQAAVDAFGRVDVVVNNAGYGTLGSIEETPADVFRAQIETNLFGVINVTRAAIPVFRKQRSGHFIQFSTIGGRRAPGYGLAAYGTSKFGVEGFSEALAAEVKPFGVRVTIIEPGGFRTDWAGSSMAAIEPGEDYRSTVGYMISHLKEGGPLNGDPTKGANVIVQVARMPEPPLRLPLGSDAVQLIRAADEAKIAEIDRWRELSVSTDAEDAVHRDLSGHNN
ncbi:oxidoreductase [Micromonospora avicenniae]|uniref:NADP-dependent 3-hydroxy acid dehydrogenase YdfG n=1 Tax=Micromonospora avicenniae TaxID=1198245 RepID=A0A1N6Y6W2_9ACTN|nr:oxidoreductase [Micromonospora avicenniae]SIR10313.1 NADP-dependent 3-hydroxy acid dehydrogenase YdfG [Micromonospora avicenniae]